MAWRHIKTIGYISVRRDTQGTGRGMKRRTGEAVTTTATWKMGTPSMETPGLEDDVFFTNSTSSPFFGLENLWLAGYLACFA